MTITHHKDPAYESYVFENADGYQDGYLTVSGANICLVFTGDLAYRLVNDVFSCSRSKDPSKNAKEDLLKCLGSLFFDSPAIQIIQKTVSKIDNTGGNDHVKDSITIDQVIISAKNYLFNTPNMLFDPLSYLIKNDIFPQTMVTDLVTVSGMKSTLMEKQIEYMTSYFQTNNSIEECLMRCQVSLEYKGVPTSISELFASELAKTEKHTGGHADNEVITALRAAVQADGFSAEIADRIIAIWQNNVSEDLPSGDGGRGCLVKLDGQKHLVVT
jgi:hypothetical protein